ncbi:TPA: hypothetical protein U5D55_001743 [Yersinia enterocolitica]|nr:hypothetical protein [Yersinia enterocolitica]EKN3974227.1 hypothetical protein [Yersinia enterocolitica]HEN3404954.1 hypothetical protein [Yersinia enterocolitica]
MKKVKSTTAMINSQNKTLREVFNPQAKPVIPGSIGKAAASKEQHTRILSLEDASFAIIDEIVNSGDFDKEDLHNDYSTLAFKMSYCHENEPCFSMACAKCADIYSLENTKHIFTNFTAESKSVIMVDFNKHIFKDYDLVHKKFLVIRHLNELKNKLIEHLNIKGVNDVIVGAWALEHISSVENPAANFWLPQLRLIVPKGRKTLSIIEKYMLSTSGAYIHDWVFNEPVRIVNLADTFVRFSCAFNPTWYEVPCSISLDFELIKGEPRQLETPFMHMALLVLNYMDWEVGGYYMDFTHYPKKLV